MTPEQVFEEVERLSPAPGLVEITGGEPMLQERELVPLMQRMLECGYKVLIETSGERPLERVPAGSRENRGCEVPGFRRGRNVQSRKSGNPYSRTMK